MKKSGILMHITSLPSPYGVGTLGKCAMEFVDFLCEGGQSYWQILPLGPTGYGDSPYQSFSTFAGNPYLIDLDLLIEQDLLKKEEVLSIDWGDNSEIDFEFLYYNRFPLLNKACINLWENKKDAITQFCEKNSSWVYDYALFMALKQYFNGISWFKWNDKLRFREKKELDFWKNKLSKEIKCWLGIQYLFFNQWKNLKDYANSKGVSIIGDLPIYVSSDSVDVWANPKLFQLDENLTPTFVAGCPPDAFSDDGQLWGNPLFNWDEMVKDKYLWWIYRIKYQCEMFDLLRIDHFRGFEAYYSIPYGEKTAQNGKWCKGPAIDFFDEVNQSIGKQNIIAEDLGLLTKEVKDMLEYTKYPGMKVLQFAFDSVDGSGYLPKDYPENCIAYIGTHDNNTIIGWLNEISEEKQNKVLDYLDIPTDNNMAIMAKLWESKANLTIVLMQDLLNLDGNARMNTPSTLGENWKWRILPNKYDKNLARKLKEQMILYKRI